MSGKVTATLGYWDCRGLAEVARMLLEYSGDKVVSGRVIISNETDDPFYPIYYPGLMKFYT